LGLSVSASKQGKELVLSLVNPKHDMGLTVTASLAGGAATGAAARILHHPDLNAFNGFADPDTITPKTHSITAQGANLKLELPPLSIATAVVKLA
jgi:alpha-N-arabinofuranosidase